MNTKFPPAYLYSCKQNQTFINCTNTHTFEAHFTHTNADTCPNTLSASMCTHPESPASLPPLVSGSLEKKRDFKNHWSVWTQILHRLSFFFPASTSSIQRSSFRPLPLRHKDFEMEAPLFSCPLLSLLTSLQCSSSQLSVPAVCLSTASPSSSSFLPLLSHFCLPAPLSLVSLR